MIRQFLPFMEFFDTKRNLENRILNIPGLTIINVSHDLQENSLNQYDEILFMQNGKIAEADQTCIEQKNILMDDRRLLINAPVVRLLKRKYDHP